MDDGPNYCVSPERSRRDQGIRIQPGQSQASIEMPEIWPCALPLAGEIEGSLCCRYARNDSYSGSGLAACKDTSKHTSTQAREARSLPGIELQNRALVVIAVRFAANGNHLHNRQPARAATAPKTTTARPLTA